LARTIEVQDRTADNIGPDLRIIGGTKTAQGQDEGGEAPKIGPFFIAAPVLNPAGWNTGRPGVDLVTSEYPRQGQTRQEAVQVSVPEGFGEGPPRFVSQPFPIFIGKQPCFLGNGKNGKGIRHKPETFRDRGIYSAFTGKRPGFGDLGPGGLRGLRGFRTGGGFPGALSPGAACQKKQENQRNSIYFYHDFFMVKQVSL
jgi:hypothetical protein